MIDCSFSQVSGAAVVKILVASLFQCQQIVLYKSQFFHLFLLKTIRHITREKPKMMCLTFYLIKRRKPMFPCCLKLAQKMLKHLKKLSKQGKNVNYLEASSTATATATVIPTMGLLPAPIRPIISTWAGTEEEPANCASECIRPMVSVIP